MQDKRGTIVARGTKSPYAIARVVPILVIVVDGLIALFGLKSVQSYEGRSLIQNGVIEENWGLAFAGTSFPVPTLGAIARRAQHTRQTLAKTAAAPTITNRLWIHAARMANESMLSASAAPSAFRLS